MGRGRGYEKGLIVNGTWTLSDPSLISLMVSMDVKHHVDEAELHVLGCRVDILGTN